MTDLTALPAPPAVLIVSATVTAYGEAALLTLSGVSVRGMGFGPELTPAFVAHLDQKCMIELADALMNLTAQFAARPSGEPEAGEAT